MTVQVSNSLFAGGSRALITDEYITSGSIGVTLVDGGGVNYDNVTYSNLQYTYADGTWGPASGVTTPPLTATVGKAAAYYPFVAGASVTAVPVTIAEQQDVLYSGWVNDISIAKPEANFHMQHALAAVRVVLKKDATYVPSATATEVSVTSDDFYPTATLDATLGDLTPTGDAGATVTSGTGSWAVTTGGTSVDLLVIPGGVVQNITFSATIGGKKYTATTPTAVTLGRALIHTYTLTLSAEGMTVGEVSVEPWGSGVTGSLTLAPVKVGPVINSEGKANGVYVVTATGQLVDHTTVDANAIGVALITDNQKILIEKNGEANTDIIKAAYDADGATNTDYKKFYWGPNDTDVAAINNSSSNDAAKQNFDGKANTAAIIATPDTDSNTTYANMGTYCKLFNEANLGYSDWYIPTLGQLSEIYNNLSNINIALANIEGTTFITTSGGYWSCCEKTYELAWYITIYPGTVDYPGRVKQTSCYVRFVRDI